MIISLSNIRSISRIQNLYNNGLGRKYQQVNLEQGLPYQNNLVSAYFFENNTLDETYKYSSTIYGSPVINNNCKLGNCYYFKGASDYLQTFEGAAQSACWFWEQNNLNRFADTGDIKGLTKAINGGYIGLEDREKHYQHALHLMGV